MGQIHTLIRTHGRDTAKALASAEDRPFVDIASRVLGNEDNEPGVTYSGFCLTGLPHRRLPDDQEWVRSNGGLSLLVQPGKKPKVRTPRTPKDYQLVGIPYGSKARLILLYLQTEALRTGSPTVSLGRSMHDWLARMDISPGGKTYDEVRTQADRVSWCRLTFTFQTDLGSGHSNESIVRHAFQLDPDERQGRLWDDCVELSETFYRLLRDHPVPVLEAAIRAIAGKSMAFDIYVWLAYRLHVLERPTPITWQALYHQFGAPVGDAPLGRRLRDFKPEFRTALRYALAVYEDARVEEDEQRGLILHPSRPPIPEREVAKLAR